MDSLINVGMLSHLPPSQALKKVTFSLNANYLLPAQLPPLLIPSRRELRVEEPSLKHHSGPQISRSVVPFRRGRRGGE